MLQIAPIILVDQSIKFQWVIGNWILHSTWPSFENCLLDGNNNGYKWKQKMPEAMYDVCQ